MEMNEDGAEHEGRKKSDSSVPMQRRRFNGVYPAPIDKLGPFGRWLRHTLLDAILVGTPVLVAIQKCRTPFRDKLMHFLSFLGTEDFYTPLILLFTWIIDARLGRLFTLYMSTGFYLASVGKNLLRLPRPPHPPVQVLEQAYDWAMPSLHSILGVVLPWYIWIYCYVHYHFTPLSLIVLFCIIAFWSFSVMFSRFYLGVHSPADIVVGGTVGVLLLSIFVQTDDYLDHYIGYAPHVILQSFVFFMVLLAIHPRSDPPTLSFADTVVTGSVAFGVVVARHRTVGQHSIVSALLEQTTDNTSVNSIVIMALARILIGFPVVLLTRSIVKSVVRSSIFQICQLFHIPAYSHADYAKNSVQLTKHYCPGFKLPPVYPEKVKKTSEIKKKDAKEEEDDENTRDTEVDREGGTSSVPVKEAAPFDVDIPTKFFTYTAMTWVAAEWCHYLFHYMNIVA
ncbi:lipid phosphate phosphatase delta isoform X1 [Lingula anatina]|uniref:Lipid phosphate phosphatase delta isoform X1 n=1 Tax=Lingula anatina TaxID=7574 RepID=A0A1S3KEN4_LINAN|nr:lipid phosphate phosphatase delta isoform X1 [Lingula anatina]|eukprot:XP_013421090.1 lipid phosphate phosphatase delta isoform X1 [Lingula anatina]